MTTTEQLQAAKAKVLEWMAGGKFLYRSIMIGDQRVELTSMTQAVAALKQIDKMIAEEAGTFSGRAYAQNGGRGYVNGCTINDCSCR